MLLCYIRVYIHIYVYILFFINILLKKPLKTKVYGYLGTVGSVSDSKRVDSLLKSISKFTQS